MPPPRPDFPVVSQPAVVGLDTASNRCHAVGPRERTRCEIPGFEQWTVKSTDSNPDVRRIALLDGAHNFFANTEKAVGPFHIFCEEPISSKNGKTTRLLGLAAGAVWAAHREFDCFWHWVDIAAWKKRVVGNGNASKADIQAWVEAQGYSYTEEDWFDAHCIREHGVQVLKAALQT